MEKCKCCENRKKDETIIEALQKEMKENGYISKDSIKEISKRLNKPESEIYGVATFYAQFSLEPKGKYEIRCCDGTACHVRGSMPVLNAIKAGLKFKEGSKTTEDGLFSLETVSCLGACGLAPVVMINEKVYPQMTSDAIKVVIDTIMKEENN